jgi:hypothetical protein
MKKTALAIFVTGFMSSPMAFASSEYETALNRHAQSTTREIIGKWIDQRAAGRSWGYMLRLDIPKVFDSQCGFRALVGLPEVGFIGARRETEPVVGKRLESLFGELLSRPGAQLQLLNTKALPNSYADQAMVSLKITPSKANDPSLTFIMQLSGDGEMVLCDIATEARPESGILYKLGKDLNL